MQKSRSLMFNRAQGAQVASFVGVLGLLLGLIGLLFQGGLSLGVGLVLAVGVAGIALWAALTPRAFVDAVTGRQMRFGTVTIFASALLIGIVTLVYLLLARNAITLDMTENERFSLSAASLNVLNRITEPIQITGFYSPRALALREVDDQFFRLYEAASDGLIRRQYIDPQEQPAMAQSFGVIEDGQVFVSYLDANGGVDMATLSRVPRGPNQERDMTQSIARLLIAGSTVAYFVQGHGERDPLDTSQEGISGINNGMRESGLVTLPLDLPALAAANGDVPGDAAALIFVRPLVDLTAEEIGVLDRYLRRGGALLLLPDVVFTDNLFMAQDGAFNTYLWQNFGLRALDAVVVDPIASGETALDIISAAVFDISDIGARLDPERWPTRFRLARAVEVNLESVPPNTANGQVVLTSQAAFGETNLAALGQTNIYQYDEGADLPGPLTTVAWASNQLTNARIVLIGDSDFATNGLVLSGGNGILFTDSVSWLTGLGERIAFDIQPYVTGLPLFASRETLDLVRLLTLIVLPGLALAVGLIVYARRVRR